MDFETVEIPDDEKQRIAEVFATLEELFVGFLEIFVLTFVFPGEVAAHPYAGEAFAAAGAADIFLKSAPFTG